MSALDKAFAFFATSPPPVGYMYATLTTTEQVSKLPAGIFTASGALVKDVPGATPTITFHVTFYCKTPPPGSPPSPFKVTLTKNPGVYNMQVAFPALPLFNCDLKVDASGVAYGSQGLQFVTLVLELGPQG